MIELLTFFEFWDYIFQLFPHRFYDKFSAMIQRNIFKILFFYRKVFLGQFILPNFFLDMWDVVKGINDG